MNSSLPSTTPSPKKNMTRMMLARLSTKPCPRQNTQDVQSSRVTPSGDGPGHCFRFWLFWLHFHRMLQDLEKCSRLVADKQCHWQQENNQIMNQGCFRFLGGNLMHRCFFGGARCLPHSFRYETAHLAAKTHAAPRFHVAHRHLFLLVTPALVSARGEGCGCAAECCGLPTWWSWHSGPDRVNRWSNMVRLVVQHKKKELLLMAAIREKPVEVGSLSRYV